MISVFRLADNLINKKEANVVASFLFDSGRYT